MENRMASALDGEAGYIPLCDLSELRPRRYFYREVSIKIEEQSYHILWFSVQSHWAESRLYDLSVASKVDLFVDHRHINPMSICF